MRLKREELEIRRNELEQRSPTGAIPSPSAEKATRTSLPAIVAIATALFGLIGTGFGVVLQGYWNARLERQKFEAALIQNALASGDEQEIAESLQFLVTVGLIQGIQADRIELAARQPAQIPETFGNVVTMAEQRTAPARPTSRQTNRSQATTTAVTTTVVPTSTTATEPSTTSTGPAVASVTPEMPSPFANVSRIQEAKLRLAKLDLYAGTIDDSPTPDLQEAVRRFQIQRGMRPDGMLGVKMFAELRSATGH